MTTGPSKVPNRLDRHLVGISRPASWETERYRALRRALERSYEPERRRLVAVTSANPGEGKTTTAINLAAVLAEVPGANVLLVDLDLRCSSVARLLGCKVSGPDLGDALEDTRLTLDEVTRTAPGILRFSVLPSRPRAALAHELVESPRLTELMIEARRTYHFVVADAPPLVPVADCRAIARFVDGFLLVVAAHRTARKDLGEGLSLIEPGKLLGLVYNGDDEPAWTGAGRYYMHYGPPL